MIHAIPIQTESALQLPVIPVQLSLSKEAQDE